MIKLFHKQNITKVSKGDLLISEPLLPDENFSRTVVLICDDTEDSYMGFVINKPHDEKLQDLITGYEDFDKTIFNGGPVQRDFIQTLHVSEGVEGAIHLGNQVFWGGDFEQIKERINLGLETINDYWFFIGYSGWADGQLSAELAENSWLVLKHDLKEVMNTPPEKLWKQCMSWLGKEYELMSKFPSDPRMN